MDKGLSLGSRKILTLAFVLFLAPAAARADTKWKTQFAKSLSRLDRKYQGGLGVYVKDLAGGDELALHADEPWYLASGVKVPIALEVLKQVEDGQVSLYTLVRLESADYIDGAGETNYKAPGSMLSVRYLLEQMLVNSDNTASDLLIRLVGIDKINARVNALVPGEFGQITTLADVRRRTYSGFHPSAARLKNADYMRLKTIIDEQARLSELAKLVGANQSEFAFKRVDDAFSAYYKSKVNTASLRSYAKLLELVDKGSALGAAQTAYLLSVLGRVKTGAARIKAGLPRTVVFAHKTGTQHARICDFGIAWNKSAARSKRFVIAACTRGIHSVNRAEAALKEVGKALKDSGALGSCNADCS